MSQTATTPTSWTDHAKFARDVYAAFVRVGVPPVAAELFTAHSSLSTGWGKSVFNWNLAGMKLCSGCEDRYDWHYALGAEEKDGVLQPKTQMRWRSFNSIDEGVRALWGNLQATRYNSARALILAGDTEYFAEVGRNGWYSAKPAEMKAQMTANLKYIWSVLGKAPVEEGGIAGTVLLAVGVYYVLKYLKVI
jgi:hypothetical protein